MKKIIYSFNKSSSMILSRKLIVMVSMAAVVTTAVAFTAPPADGDNGYKNLKVLPKDISKEKLGKIMHGFNDALGVHCSFCHAPSKDTTISKWPDFASDEKPEKDIARSMMKMTLRINKKFFGVKHPALGEQMEVSCVTCHHGEAHPEEPKEEAHKPGPGGNQPPPPPPANKQ